MPTIKSNINEFNEYVQYQLHALAARGETTSDLLVHLFAAYKVASDHSFRKLAQDEEVLYERGTPMTAEGLMAVMLARWETLTDKEMWNAPSQEEEQMMVMRTELEELKAKKKVSPQGDLLKTLKERVQKKMLGLKKKQAPKYKGKSFKEDPEWLAKSEKPNPLTKVMQHRNKAWHWCSPETGGKCNGKWRVHKPSEYKGFKARSEGGNKDGGDGGSNNELKLMKALSAIMGEDDEDTPMDIDEDNE